ncbi:MAG: DUF3147 family protein [Candidatus Micrarchaeota archaeon]
MNYTFFFKVFLSFLVAGIWITVITRLSESKGTKLGGILAGMPSNLVISMIFVAWTQNTMIASESASIVPLAMIIDSIFLFVFVLACKRYKESAFVISIISWAICAHITSFFTDINMWIGVIIYTIITLALFYYLEKTQKINSNKRAKNIEPTKLDLVLRGTGAGLVVAGVVVLVYVLGPQVGGIFAVFPAVMLCTLFILNKSQGIEFAQSSAKVR